MDTEKEIVQCPIRQKTYSIKHIESIASKMPPNKAKKIQTLPIRVDFILFYNGCFRSNNVWEDRMGRKTIY